MLRVILACCFISASAAATHVQEVLEPDGEVKPLLQGQEQLVRRQLERTETAAVEEKAKSIEKNNTLYVATNSTAVIAKYDDSVEQEHKQAVRAIGLSSFGTITIAVLLFYLVKLPNKQINLATWSYLSGTTSLFMVLLLFMASKKIWKLEDNFRDYSNEKNVVINVCRFVFLFFGLTYASLKFELRGGYPVTLAAFRTINVHLIGFAGADAGGDFLRMQPWRDNRGWLWFGVMICLSFYGLLLLANFYLSAKVRAMSRRNSTASEDPEAYNPDAERDVIESFCFTSGFLWSVFIRYEITGYVPGTRSNAIEERDCLILLGVCIVAIVVYFCAAAFLQPMIKNESKPPKVRRLCKIVNEQLAMIMAWCLYYYGLWQIWHWIADNNYRGNDTYKISALLGCAVYQYVVSAVVLALAGAFFSKMGGNLSEFTSLINAMVLQTAMASESAYYNSAITGFVKNEDDEKREEDIALIFLTVLVLLPGWFKFIVPETLTLKNSEEENADEGDNPFAGKVEEEKTAEKEETTAKKDEKGGQEADQATGAAASTSSAAPAAPAAAAETEAAPAEPAAAAETAEAKTS